MQRLALRAVLGLGDRAGCGEGGGVEGGVGGAGVRRGEGIRIKATSWMAREIMT